MGQISEALQNLRPSFTEIMNPSLELINNQNAQVNIGSADHHGILGFSSGTFLHHQQSQLLINLTDDFGQESKTLKSMPGIDSLVDLSSPLESGTGFIGKDKSLSGRKRKRKNIIDVKKPKDVIHVRAKRGEATDSHSLAERVRREKINERLRCLQDLVPGCYKTMGMAVMLDVIINYVQSLHNQIEFLSMKLSAASMCYDFNMLEMDSTESWQGPNPCEVQEMEMLIKEGYGGSSCFHSTWP